MGGRERHFPVVRDNQDYQFQYLAITPHLNQMYYQLTCSEIVLPNYNQNVEDSNRLMYQAMNKDDDVSIRNTKLLCVKCDWRGMAMNVDRVSDPRGDNVWMVCPKCRTPENFRTACDETDCWLEFTRSTPVAGGYRHTCNMHKPQLINQR